MSKFLIVTAIVYAAMCFGICFCFVRTLKIGRVFKAVLYGAAILSALMAIAYLPLRRRALLPGYFEDFFALMIGVVFIWFIAALLSDWAVRVARRATKSEKYTAKIQISAMAIAASYLIYGVISASTAPLITRVAIETPLISKPITIAHLTDLHLGNGAAHNLAYAERIAAQTSALNPDIVAITGDLVDAPIGRIREALKAIAKIKTKYGIYFVTGNHEAIARISATKNSSNVMDYIESLGIKVLRNDSTRVSGDFGSIDIAGVFDLSGKRYGVLVPDPKKALAETNQSGFVLALAHQPNAILDFPPNSFDLALCGHTHGGQIFPFTLFVRLAQPYVSGLYRRDDRGRVFVSRGVGYWGPPLRMFAPNEIAIITLFPKDQK